MTPWPDKKNRPQYHKMQPKVELDIDIPPGPQYAHLLFYNAGPRSPIGLPFNDIGEPTIRQVEFTMKLAAVDERDNVRENLHTFTSIQSETGSAPKCLEQIADWQILFPALASHFDRDHTAAPIFLFSASLSLPKLNGIATSHETKNLSKKLPISLNIDFAQGARYCDWRSGKLSPCANIFHSGYLQACRTFGQRFRRSSFSNADLMLTLHPKS